MRVRSVIGTGLFLGGTAVVFALDAVGGPLLQAAAGLQANDVHAAVREAGVLASPTAGLPLLGVAALIALRTRRGAQGR